jgi:hypothetical protein
VHSGMDELKNINFQIEKCCEIGKDNVSYLALTCIDSSQFMLTLDHSRLHYWIWAGDEMCTVVWMAV